MGRGPVVEKRSSGGCVAVKAILLREQADDGQAVAQDAAVRC
jgi:hypothetical protein